jgi:hypothetical protein
MTVLVYYQEQIIYLYQVVATRYGLMAGDTLTADNWKQIVSDNAQHYARLNTISAN